MKHTLTLLALLSVLRIAVSQGSVTGMQGYVFDNVTGEPLPFVQVGFVGTHIGTSTDMQGRFYVSNSEGADTIRIQMLGYEPMVRVIAKNHITRNAKIALMPKSNTMRTVTISAKKGKGTRYRRRDNPAVELAEKVIERKERNHEQSLERFSRQVYEKTNMALDDFHPDFEKKRIWRKLRFLEKYIDQTPFDATPILTISLREVMMRESWLLSKRQRRTLITARRQDGLDELLGQEGIDESLGAMFSPIDIYSNDIELMMNHFTSPLNSTLATVFYRFYITDTIEINGVQCAELSFVPANERSYGFIGQMYITLDGSYNVAKYSMKVSPEVNLNFVRDLTVIQTYGYADSGTVSHMVPLRCDTYGRLFVHKRLQEVYAHQVRVMHDYNYSDTVASLPDSLFGPLTNTAQLPKTFMRRKIWNELRPIELTAKETVIDSLRYELARLPEMKALRKIAEIVITGYVPTRTSRDSSLWDFGSIYNFVSYNHQEGWRLRLGGTTTAALCKRDFVEGYIAYGFRDQRPKGELTYTHTLQDRKHNAHERPLSLWNISAGYDIEVPGQFVDETGQDNIIASNGIPHNVQYVAQLTSHFTKEWQNHTRIDTWITGRHVEPSGSLRYEQLNGDGSTTTWSRIAEAEWGIQCGAEIGAGIIGWGIQGSAPTGGDRQIRKGALSLTLEHRAGLLAATSGWSLLSQSDAIFTYQRTEFAAEKRFALGVLGYLDGRLKTGAVWGRVPYPLLFFGEGNDNLFLSNKAFNSMHPMELAMDKYISLMATYHMKGLLLNNIPLINKLRLREVASFKVMWGHLSERNNPEGTGYAGLLRLPSSTTPIGATPYMEMSVGIENIFKILRVDFVRRLSYTDGMTSKQKNSIRLQFRFEL